MTIVEACQKLRLLRLKQRQEGDIKKYKKRAKKVMKIDIKLKELDIALISGVKGK